MNRELSETARIGRRVVELGARVDAALGLLVSVQRYRSSNVRFARGEGTTNGDVDETEIAVTAFSGRKSATARGNQRDEQSLVNLVERAAAMAKVRPDDPEAMPLLEPSEASRIDAPVDAAFDRATAELTADARADIVSAALAASRHGGGARAIQLAGYLGLNRSEWSIVNSVGLVRTHRASDWRATVTARIGDGRGSGWAGAESVKLAELNMQALTMTAVDKAIRSNNPTPLDPGKYTVILEPAAVANLVGFLAGGLSSRAAEEGRSYFSKSEGRTKIGEHVAHDAVTFRSDPRSAATPFAPFDGEGFSFPKSTWIERGVLTELARNRYWANKTGAAPTGMHRAFQLLPGDAGDLASLIAGTERGVLVTRFWYNRWLDQRAMMVTGLTRDGVFLIEKGKIVRPVNNFRYNESPIRLLANIEAIASQSVRVPNGNDAWSVPAIRSRDFEFSSVSAAV